jgi:hypothetical protein
MPVPDILKFENFNPLEKHIYGEIEVKSTSDKRMQMSGFVSTDSPDLSNEIVQVNSFAKYLDYYKRNPIYCYDHDRTIPIGKVLNPYVVATGSKKGLYLEDITLTPLPVVKEIIWPLVLDEVLTQQSIGFFSLDGKYLDGIYNHTMVYVIEGSLVPVACNPTATIDAVKQLTKGAWTEEPDWERLTGMDGLMKAHSEGRLRLPSEVRRSFSMPGIPIIQAKFEAGDLVATNRPEDGRTRKGIIAYVVENGGVSKNRGQESRDAQPGNPAVQVSEVDENYKETGIAIPCNASELTLLKTAKELGDNTTVNKNTPDFSDIEVLKAPECLDLEGVAVAKPRKNQKNYLEVCDRIYAAKSSSRGSYLFQIAQPTEKGFIYDWKLTSLSMARVLGAQGGFHATDEQKGAVVERIAEAYRAMEKAVPTIKFNDGAEPYELAVDQVTVADLVATPYSDIIWHNDEKSIIELTIFENSLTEVGNAIKHWTKDGGSIPAEAVEMIGKNLYGWVDVSIYAPVYDTDSLTFLNTVVGMIQAYMTQDEGESQTPLYFSADDGTAKEVNYEALANMFAEKAKEQAARKTADVQKSIAIPETDLKALEDLRDILNRF